jgi:hypothetical protein
MNKLLNAYRAAPTMKNAIKLRMYDKMHPMAKCMLSKEDGELLDKALAPGNGPQIIFTHIG